MMTLANNNSDKKLDKKTLSVVHLLYPYTKQRIRVGEMLGIFPRNMYKSNEIIDEVVLEIYENGLHKSRKTDELRLMMFQMLNDRMASLFKSEEWHKNAISTKYMLENELKQLEENFTIDADNDYIMNEDLDDISYHQKNKGSDGLPYDKEKEGIKSFLGLDQLDNFDDNSNGNLLRRVYYKLPVNTSNIVDLYILGKLSYNEIAGILKMNISEVKEIVEIVRKTIKKQLEP